MGRKKSTLSKQYFLNYWTTELTNLVCSLFKWYNLPEEINSSAVEKTIMLNGFVIFFKDTLLDKYFMLGGALTGVDPYGYPTTAQPIAKNGDYQFGEYKVNQDCVVLWANIARTSAQLHINEYAEKLTDIDLAIKMNTLALKKPVMIKATEQSRASIETAFNQYEDNYYMIIGDKSMNTADIDTMDLHVTSQEILNLQKQKETIKNEFFNLFGIAGSVEKRERMISGEMNAQLQQVGVNHNIWMAERQKGIEKLNKIFGVNVECKFNEDDALKQALKQAKIQAQARANTVQNNNDNKGGKKDAD